MGLNPMGCSPNDHTYTGEMNNGCKYMGSSKDGMKDGIGYCKCLDIGYYYDGNWFQNKKHGEGKLRYNNEIYNGSFSHG